ncbi:hypothetical protein [Pseudomonas sp. zfem002]|uniref:hypothetical protein n=1 Tax=Pseudomonas sp. zfem002 TaxID=3078197 RepID=UPI0029297C54|nr:hypothetical protein [Pseudomonas sp. zfem002]MDU9390983.1 hypothetical protein [Pseudomonas sp. zfem002]
MTILPASRFSPNLTLDLLTEVAPELEILEREQQLEHLSELLQPALDIVVSAFKLASVTEVTAQAFQLFLKELVIAAGSEG